MVSAPSLSMPLCPSSAQPPAGLVTLFRTIPATTKPWRQHKPKVLRTRGAARRASFVPCAGAVGTLAGLNRRLVLRRRIASSVSRRSALNSGPRSSIAVEDPDIKLALVLAGFSFDAYNEVDKSSGFWVSDGSGVQPNINGVRTVLLAPRFVKESCRGILRARVLSAENLREIPMAGNVAVVFRVAAGKSPWAFRSGDRCATKRGIFGGAVSWTDEDESVYLYVPRCSAGSDDAEPVLGVEVQVRDMFDAQRVSVCGRLRLPFATWNNGKLCEMTFELGCASDEEREVDAPYPSIRLQLYYDDFDGGYEVSEDSVAETLEMLDDVTAQSRSLRQRWGSAVPAAVRFPAVEHMSEQELRSALRRRALPCLGDSRNEMSKRLSAALEAENKLRDAGSLWKTFEGILGADARQSLESGLGTGSFVAESLKGDFFGALGTGLAAGAKAVPGMNELLSGDIVGAFEARRKVIAAAVSEEGRQALQQRVAAASKRAQQQAIIRLANGMELTSVRKGAWKMLEQAVASESGGAESFGDYEQLVLSEVRKTSRKQTICNRVVLQLNTLGCQVYLEALSTSTECYVWRLRTHRRLLVTFRGTSDFGDVLVDLAMQPSDLGDLGRVHGGFSRAYDSIRRALKAALAHGCYGDGAGWEVLFTGHSLGGALATLASLDVARESVASVESDENHARSPLSGLRITACTFGAPRVGDARFCQLYDQWVPQCWRVYSKSDIIPHAPPVSFFNFRHVGIALELDPEGSTLIVRGRESMNGEGMHAPHEGSVDVWGGFDANELDQLRRVLGTGTQAVSEHMEDNYFRMIQECCSAELMSEPLPFS